MRNDPEAVVTGLYAAWQLQDIEAVLAYCHDDIRYAVHQPNGITGLGGEMVGKDALRRYLRAICATWEFAHLAPGALRVDGDLVRETMSFHAIHRQTGLPLEGRKRHVWQVVDGRVAVCDEFQDAEKINAFLRMVGAR